MNFPKNVFFLVAFVFTTSIYSMESTDSASSSLTKYQKEKLAMMKKHLELKEKTLKLQELEFMTKNISETFLTNSDPEYALLVKAFFNIRINDLFFEHLEEQSKDARERTTKLMFEYKKRLAEERGVDFEHVFDLEVEEEAHYKKLAEMIEKSRVDATRIVKERSGNNK